MRREHPDMRPVIDPIAIAPAFVLSDHIRMDDLSVVRAAPPGPGKGTLRHGGCWRSARPVAGALRGNPG
jgi:hypothetical protein